MALVKFDGENHSTADTWVVAVYDTDRHYGGPEEGGWWYDSRELVAIATATDSDDATRIVEELGNGEYESKVSRYSVNYPGTGDYAMYVYEPGGMIVHNEPTERPHYE